MEMKTCPKCDIIYFCNGIASTFEFFATQVSPVKEKGLAIYHLDNLYFIIYILHILYYIEYRIYKIYLSLR